MRKWVLFLSIAMLAQALPAYADSSDQMASMFESMKQQMAKMQQTIDQQNMRLQQLESHMVAAPTQPSAAPTMSDADFQKGLKDNIGEAIPWLTGAK